MKRDWTWLAAAIFMAVWFVALLPYFSPGHQPKSPPAATEQPIEPGKSDADFTEFTKLLNNERQDVKLAALETASLMKAPGEYRDYIEMVALRTVRYGETGDVRGQALLTLCSVNPARCGIVVDAAEGHIANATDTDAVLAGMAIANERDQHVMNALSVLRARRILGLDR